MKNYTLRLSDDLHARLEKSARDSHRSLQAEIIFRLEGSLGLSAVPERMVAVGPQVEAVDSALAGKLIVDVSPAAPLSPAPQKPGTPGTKLYGSEKPRAGRRTMLCAHRVPVGSYCSRCD